MITAENARDLQRKGVEARKAYQKERELQETLAAIAVIAPVVADDYIAAKLVRVRKQLARLDDLLDEESDPQKIDRLASAIARLSEIERILRGSPLPGSRRPAPDRTDRRPSRAVVMYDEPLSQIVSQPPTNTPNNPTNTVV